MLSEPLRDRFAHQASLVPYTDNEMVDVLTWTARARQAEFTPEALDILIGPCHGTARKAVTFVEACLDTQAVEGAGGCIKPDQVHTTLTRLGYLGALDTNEWRYLQALEESGRPMGLSAIASRLQEDTRTVEDVLEPWLFRQGYVQRLPQGRQLTPKGQQLLAKKDV